MTTITPSASDTAILTLLSAHLPAFRECLADRLGGRFHAGRFDAEGGDLFVDTGALHLLERPLQAVTGYGRLGGRGKWDRLGDATRLRRSAARLPTVGNAK
jgi:hypothetical protein